MSEDPQEIVAPPHYIDGRKFQPADVIDDWDLGRWMAAALKYIARCGRKGDDAAAMIDLRKARWYLDREIMRREAKR